MQHSLLLWKPCLLCRHHPTFFFLRPQVIHLEGFLTMSVTYNWQSHLYMTLQRETVILQACINLNYNSPFAASTPQNVLTVSSPSIGWSTVQCIYSGHFLFHNFAFYFFLKQTSSAVTHSFFRLIGICYIWHWGTEVCCLFKLNL